MPDIATHPVHLDAGSRIVPQPEFTGMEWYAGYAASHAADGAAGRLVSMHAWDAPWPAWEMHPHGDELVVCVEGSIILHQEFPDGRRETTPLNPGEYAINPAGVWHTADVTAPARALFVTAGLGTEGRPR